MELESTKIFREVIDLLKNAREKIKNTIDNTMTNTYYEIGKIIVEEEQNGEKRAEYGKEIIKKLSILLTNEFGRGFSKSNIEQMRKFYLIYSKAQTVSGELGNDEKNDGVLIINGGKELNLSWSHYLFLMRLEYLEERNFYEIEAFKNNWSVRELKRQFDTGLYQRLKLSRDKNKVKELSLRGQIIETPSDLVKDPYVLEFLGLEESSIYTENELESRIINKLEHFLLELGTGFLFSGRQVRVSFDEKHFYVDLVFYNRLLKCFVLIDLKIGELKHQDIGQMQMYVNYYDRKIKSEEENKTIGIILCRDKSKAIVEMTLPEDNTQIFASKYELVLPSKEELKKIVEE